MLIEFILFNKKQSVSAKFIEPCPLPEGEIGVYTISAAAEVITNCFTQGGINLTQDQFLFVLKDSLSINVANYLYDYCTPESKSIAINGIDTYNNYNIDLINSEHSQKSPYNVNLSKVIDSIALPQRDSTKIANQKFLCVYDKLTDSPTFKNLFIETFGDSEKFDVKFEIVNNLSTNGQTGGLVYLTHGQLNSVDLTIKLNRDKIISRPSIAVARTIIHESIHAYLKLKYRDCNSGATLDFLNNIKLGELLNEYFTNGQCNSGIGQHGFMTDYMLPMMQNCLSEVMNDLVPLDHQQKAEGLTFYNQQLGVNQLWDWDNFYFFFSLEGLQESNSHIELIQNNASAKFLYDKYRYTGSYDFSKNSCPE